MDDGRKGDDKPDPLSDVVKGFSLLLRAARTTVERMPKKGLEDAVMETAREVGRAIENVANAVEREVFGHRPPERGPHPDAHEDKDHEDKDPLDPPPTPPHTD
jgi:hypothetical protein